MKKITIVLAAFLMFPCINYAQIHFKFDTSVDNMGEIVINAEAPNTQTCALKYRDGQSGTISATLVYDANRPNDGMGGTNVLEITDVNNFAEFSNLPTTGNYTISFWHAYTAGIKGDLGLFMQDANQGLPADGGKRNLRVYMGLGPNWAIPANSNVLAFDNVPGIQSGLGAQVAVGQWNHFVFAFDEFANKITTYRNGVLVEEKDYSSKMTFSSITHNRWLLGAYWGATTRGRYDDFMLHSTKLTDAQVTALYNSQVLLSTKNNIGLESQIKLYPNPVNDVFKIETTNSTQISEVIVYDLLGKKASQVTPTQNKNEYNINKLSSGLYVVKISDVNGNTITKRIVKN